MRKQKVELIIIHKGIGALIDPPRALCPACLIGHCLAGYCEDMEGNLVGDGSWACQNCGEVYEEGDYELVEL